MTAAALAAERSSPLAARLAMLSAAAVASLIVLLHALKPEFEPSWRFLSEYAIGRHGWVMSAAFMTWAAGCVALFAALRREVASRAGRAGVWLLLVVAAALAAAGLFAQDPVTAKPDELTRHGSLHAMASMVGIPGIPVAAVLIGLGLGRNPRWAAHRRPLMLLAHLTWISLVLMTAYLAWAVPRAGGFTPEVWAGWMNRLVVATYLAWQFGAAALAARLARG